MQLRENGCDVAKTRFFINDPGKSIYAFFGMAPQLQGNVMD